MTPTPAFTVSAPGSSAPSPAIPGAPGGAAAAGHASRPAPPAPPPQLLPVRQRLPNPRYLGVRRASGPGGWWEAHVLVDPERGEHRTLGPFPDEHAAALAHDRVAIAFLGDSARANFRPAFHAIEQRFLRLCRTRGGQIDVCRLVADGTYEDRYATFLRAVLALQRWGEYLNVVIDFFIGRAFEIGEDALVEGGEKLAARFVEMHRNKVTKPGWREWYVSRVMDDVAKEKQQRDGGGCAGASAVQQSQL